MTSRICIKIIQCAFEGSDTYEIILKYGLYLIILKSRYTGVCYFFFFLLAAACGNLCSLTRNQTRAPCSGSILKPQITAEIKRGRKKVFLQLKKKSINYLKYWLSRISAPNFYPSVSLTSHLDYDTFYSHSPSFHPNS